MSPGGFMGHTGKLTKKKSVVGRAEETKVNFFDPNDGMYDENEQDEEH